MYVCACMRMLVFVRVGVCGSSWEDVAFEIYLILCMCLELNSGNCNNRETIISAIHTWSPQRH